MHKTDIRVALERAAAKATHVPKAVAKSLRRNSGIKRPRRSWHVQRNPHKGGPGGCCQETGWWCQGKRGPCRCMRRKQIG